MIRVIGNIMSINECCPVEFSEVVFGRAHQHSGVLKQRGKQSMTVQTPWSVRMADSVMQRDSILAGKWAYEWGVVLKGVEQVWWLSGEQNYFDYIKRNVDEFVEADGTIRTYRMEQANASRAPCG
jgi:rhamnogalacturonyl hydrolase YesR